MKRIRKRTDKEFHVAAPVRRKVNNISLKERPVVIPIVQPPEPRSLTVEWYAPSVTLSSRDRASQLILSEDQMSCKGVEVYLYSLLS